MFRSMGDPSEIDLLVSHSEKQEPSARWVEGLLARGESRLVWCRMAVSEDGALKAAHVLDSWSPDQVPGGTPTFVQLLGHTDTQAAVALLEHDLRAFGAADIDARLVVDADATPQLRTLRAQQQHVLEAAGFDVDVERVRWEWLGPPRPRPAGRLTFRPAATVTEEELIGMFAEVGDGSVDHAMLTGRAEHGRRQEAVTRLARARRRTYDADWFVVGVDGAGTPVGYVQSALDHDGRAILAEIGVVESRRGHRYVDELLAYGTGVLADRREVPVRAFSDAANRAMRAAFTRGGYSRTGSRRDYHRPPTATPG